MDVGILDTAISGGERQSRNMVVGRRRGRALEAGRWETVGNFASFEDTRSSRGVGEGGGEWVEDIERRFSGGL